MQTNWHMPVIPALVSQADLHEFEVSMGYGEFKAASAIKQEEIRPGMVVHAYLRSQPWEGRGRWISMSSRQRGLQSEFQDS